MVYGLSLWCLKKEGSKTICSSKKDNAKVKDCQVTSTVPFVRLAICCVRYLKLCHSALVEKLSLRLMSLA